MSIKLSAYGTSFNSKSTIIPFVQNLFSTFSDIEMELVLVDNYSNDGTYEILKELQSKYNIQLYKKKSNRGLGRNIAFDKTEGIYTISVDVDEIFVDGIYKNILINHNNLLDKNGIVNFELCKRDVIERAGNWNQELNAAEDIELKARILKTGGRLIAIPAMLKADINVLNGKVKGKSGLNESRYSKGIAYWKRLSGYLKNTVQGYGLQFSDLKYYKGYKKIGILYGLSVVKSKKLKVYRQFESTNNLQATESAKNFVSPNIFGIPKNRWITTLSPNIDEHTINVKIGELKNLGFNYVYRDNNNIVVSFMPQEGR